MAPTPGSLADAPTEAGGPAGRPREAAASAPRDDRRAGIGADLTHSKWMGGVAIAGVASLVARASVA